MKLTRSVLLSFLMLLAIDANTQEPKSQAPKERPTHTKVVLLGTGTPVPDPDRSGPATAIVVGDSAYLVDFGPGVVRRAEAAVLGTCDQSQAEIACCLPHGKFPSWNHASKVSVLFDRRRDVPFCPGSTPR